MGKYLSIPVRKKCSDESFCNCFPHRTQNGTGLGEGGSGVGGQDRVGSPCVNQEILGPTCHILLYSWLQPHDDCMWQEGWLGWPASVLLNHREGRFGTWPWGSWVPRAECHPVSWLMAFVASCFKRLALIWTVWPNVLPVHIRHLFYALSFKDSGFAIGLPWRSARIWACFISLLLSLSWALAFLSCSLL